MEVFLFDLFPVELLHTIFQYLWAHEILYGFCQQNDYLDGVLINYDRYSINLCPMLKSRFDEMCRQIRPSQIISLTIMDEDKTPDQSKLFFSRFKIEEFVRLRSFSILSNDQSVIRQLILLSQLNNFKCLAIPKISQAYWSIFGVDMERIFPQLRRLLTNEYPLTKSLPSLQHLTVTHYQCYRLEQLFRQMTNLRSLNIAISLDIFPNWSKKIPLMIHLRQFAVRIHYGRLTMVQIHEILSKMPNLMDFEIDTEDSMEIVGDENWQTLISHLNLDIDGSRDIIDGNHWKHFVSRLRTFDFRFRLSHICSDRILDSFRSSFWLEQKQWLVALDNTQSPSCLFTVPRFAPKSIIYSSNYRAPICTSSELCLDRFVETLTVPILRPLSHHFTNVTSLILETNDNSDTFLRLPRLHSLSLGPFSLTTEIVLESIRILNLKRIVSKLSGEQLCSTFPKVERLEILIDDSDTMLFLIDQLKYLSIATFVHCDFSSIKTLTHQWFIEHSSRLMTNNHFTCGIDGNKINLWMNTE